ncbi:sugar transferase [Dankookia sp. P2]|uniref:sugar transferase n=1 Tax=Dankookia sp. P2 TaxID=3423955 RepID=UPI003D67F4FB
MTLLLLTLPVMLVVAFVIRRDGGPAVFRHTRIGLGGRPFPCLKFRSMVMDADQRLAALLAADPAAAEEWATRRKLPRDPRITRIGAFLRRTSLDELPQLFNVLRGEMSLVGPRPVVQEELDLHYSPAAAAAYCEMRPGVTGLWQISGRSDTTYVERVTLDTRYVRGWSLLFDIKILLEDHPRGVEAPRRGLNGQALRRMTASLPSRQPHRALPGLPQAAAGTAQAAALDPLTLPRQTRAPTAADVAVGLRIRTLRRAAGRTQKQLALHVGVTNAQLHRYEAGISRVAAGRLVAIAQALEVRVEDLLSEGGASAAPAMPHGEEFASLARAFAAITDARHRAALISLANTMAGATAALPPGEVA